VASAVARVVASAVPRSPVVEFSDGGHARGRRSGSWWAIKVLAVDRLSIGRRSSSRLSIMFRREATSDAQFAVTIWEFVIGLGRFQLLPGFGAW
jgi:hypothetical protein